MANFTRVCSALLQLFGLCAEKAAAESKVIQRRRKFSAMSLAKTFILGFLHKPDASDEELALMAAQCGVPVTPQAISQRHGQPLVDFAEGLFRGAIRIVVGSDLSLAPILERFSRVIVLDSTTISLPDSMAERFPGCGGPHKSGKAALKLQVEWDLRSGALTHIEIEPGKRSDNGTVRQEARQGPGTLRIADLGYFNTEVFAEMTAAGEHFLSRLQFGTGVLSPEEEELDLMRWLPKQGGGFIDRKIILGLSQRLPCRLIAWRVPEEVANQRRRDLHKEFKSKSGNVPSAARLAWCDWTILVTDLGPEELTPEEGVVLYRARWQVELLFKRWKSSDLVAVKRGGTEFRQMVGVWARLTAAVVRHWLMVGTSWGDARVSLHKACEAIRGFVGRIAAALMGREELWGVLIDLERATSCACPRNPRKKTGTFELLNDVTLLGYC